MGYRHQLKSQQIMMRQAHLHFIRKKLPNLQIKMVVQHHQVKQATTIKRN